MTEFKLWKPGQLVTIDNKIYRVTKRERYKYTFSSVCAQCRTANTHFRRHDEDSCCPSWQLKQKCLTCVPYSCFLKPIN